MNFFIRFILTEGNENQIWNPINFDPRIFTYFYGKAMRSTPRYSVIIPVYNRPDELRELLQSLTLQTVTDFEVIVVEDGSEHRCDHVVDAFREQLTINYIFKPNSGPGPSRNLGFKHAQGKYFVVFDSDCIIPPNYFEVVDAFRAVEPFDAWGGPDRSHESFSPLQQAMAYTMSSTLTTGGIRGRKKAGFQPRSFNMGMSRQVVEKTQGFVFTRLAEDIELDIRMRKAGFKVVLIPEAFVYHKRRTTLGQFYKQVSNFGRGRIRVGRVHSGVVKLTHGLPTIFLAGLLCLPFLYVLNTPLFILTLVCYLAFCLAILADAYQSTKNIQVAFLSIPSAFVQLTGYGSGFFKEWIGR
jgi:glycosyltransferase involved in cell wall biosynthesis